MRWLLSLLSSSLWLLFEWLGWFYDWSFYIGQAVPAKHSPPGIQNHFISTELQLDRLWVTGLPCSRHWRTKLQLTQPLILSRSQNWHEPSSLSRFTRRVGHHLKTTGLFYIFVSNFNFTFTYLSTFTTQTPSVILLVSVPWLPCFIWHTNPIYLHLVPRAISENSNFKEIVLRVPPPPSYLINTLISQINFPTLSFNHPRTKAWKI